MIRDPLALAALLAALVAAAFWLDRHVRRARLVGASLLVIVFGALVSNLGLVPAASPVYALITGPVTSLAIVWLLLAVDLGALAGAGPRMLAAFFLAVAATLVGALVASAALGGWLGDDTWRLAGVMTGTYSGGSLNFVAVGRTVHLGDNILAAAVASDNVLTALWMGATLLLPGWLARFWPVANSAQAAGDDGVQGADWRAERAGQAIAEDPFSQRFAPSLFEVSVLLGLGFGISWLAEVAAARLPGVAVVWLTTFTLLAGLLPVVRKLRGAFELGLLALQFFFAVIGIGSRFADIVRVGPAVFLFTAIVVLVHGVLLFAIARRVGLDLPTTAVASQAAVGGPSTALALATARGWAGLAAPGTLVGLLGYAAGTYAGLAAAALVRSWM